VGWNSTQRWRERASRKGVLTFLLLWSHFLFFSGAGEGDETAIALHASIGANPTEARSIPNKNRGGVGEGKMGENRGRRKRGGMGRQERRDEVIYTDPVPSLPNLPPTRDEYFTLFEWRMGRVGRWKMGMGKGRI
jgi:hypothetical protein